ncbi:ABC transporter ATP-binding protein [Microvirga antarctica]|uniref:ABC transporter ATP-binding protein n=1 Tax=Microvirga antarctica TaxID=2819233 RepID=UPI001B3054BA|nr:ABC transporter ATP-binding protein [Microvirga antarctica]
MSDVSFRAVTKQYGAVTALHALDLDIKSGEFVSLLGPSGSGKTTTLNLLAGLVEADSGEISIGNRRVNDLPPDRRDIAMVFQNYALYPHLTVFENLAFPLKAKGRQFTSNQISKKVENVAQILGIEALLARYPKELSGGQQQRVALGRGMVRDPHVFLLDEPLSNLDARLRIRMRRDIKALHDRLGSTIVYVTHDQAEALTMSSRIAVFDGGALQQFASPVDIYNFPANMFVANFVGEREINFLHGTIADERFHGSGVTVPLGRSVDGFAIAADGATILGIRTEGVVAGVVAADRASAIVEQIEMIGPQVVLYVKVGSESISCIADPTIHFAKGAAVGLTFDLDKLHFFDPETQKALRKPNQSVWLS